jgi:hypothetical protein
MVDEVRDAILGNVKYGDLGWTFCAEIFEKFALMFTYKI